jgi:hypothetical protein
MWDELGRETVVLRFRNGELESYEMEDYASDADRLTCRYRRGQLIEGEATSCPPFEDVKGGLPNVEVKDEPVVPPERDPRR